MTQGKRDVTALERATMRLATDHACALAADGKHIVFTDALGTRDLSGAALISFCQPGEMGLSMMRRVRLNHSIFAAQQANTDPASFRFPKLRDSDFHAACGGAFDWYGGLDEVRARHIYEMEGTR